MNKAKTPKFGIRFRAILLGLILVPFNCYWVTITEIKWCSNDSTCVSLFMTVVFLLFMLTLANLLIARRFPGLALNQGELMVVYIMLSISTAMCGHDMMGNLLPNITNVFWFDNPQNDWQKFHRYIPKWFAVRDKEVLRGFYEGNSTFYTKEHILAWLTPIAVWGTFMVVIAFTLLCINVVVRKQWSDRERLSFPIIQMPLEMTKEGGRSGFFGNKFLWIGFTIPVLLETLNNLNFFYPSVPYVQIKVYNIGQFIQNRPWNGVGWFPISFYPFAIGLTFFLPADLSFSCWFFYVFRKMLDVFAVAMGWRDAGASPAMQRFPYFAEQADGAWIILALIMVYGSRNYLRQVIRRALGKESELDDSTEPMSYRTAFIGIGFGLVFLYAFCVLAGASPFVPVVFFALYFIVAIAITRIRAELGPPAHELNFYRPEEIMTAAFGTQALGIRNLTIISYFYWFNRGYRNLVAPHQLEAFKIGEVCKSSGRKLTIIIMIAVVLGIISTFWSLLHMYYINGAATAKIIAGYRTGIGNYAFDRLNSWVLNPKKPDGAALTAMAAGGTFAIFLTAMKSRFLWWPFHPIGYGLAVSYAMDYFWFTAFIGWFCKFLTLRYGGIKLYRTLLPFFMGLILGDYVIASTWTLIGWALGIPIYRQFIF
ncbi:MAG: hypothetical protein QME62_03995 [Armatimonadota bacterium]|nr:hypothetical protein [Armatimonadota bacterium]